jgi:hypothetical protein
LWGGWRNMDWWAEAEQEENKKQVKCLAEVLGTMHFSLMVNVLQFCKCYFPGVSGDYC